MAQRRPFYRGCGCSKSLSLWSDGSLHPQKLEQDLAGGVQGTAHAWQGGHICAGHATCCIHIGCAWTETSAAGRSGLGLSPGKRSPGTQSQTADACMQPRADATRAHMYEHTPGTLRGAWLCRPHLGVWDTHGTPRAHTSMARQPQGRAMPAACLIAGVTALCWCILKKLQPSMGQATAQSKEKERIQLISFPRITSFFK